MSSELSIYLLGAVYGVITCGICLFFWRKWVPRTAVTIGTSTLEVLNGRMALCADGVERALKYPEGYDQEAATKIALCDVLMAHCSSQDIIVVLDEFDIKMPEVQAASWLDLDGVPNADAVIEATLG